MGRIFRALIVLLSVLWCVQAQFYESRNWKWINFTWPDQTTYQTAQQNQQYIRENILIAGVKYFEDYYYITLPRMKPGVPATLARIPAGPTNNPSPLFEPYPSWSMNQINDCNNLHFVQNIEIDTQGNLWIIDGGRINTLQVSEIKCQPKLVIYDIRNNRTTTVYQFPEEIAPKNGSFLYDLVVDNTDGGYAYITDNSVNDPGIIVYSVKENRSWKIRKSRGMFADPFATQFTVNGISIPTPINIAGIALSPSIHSNNMGQKIVSDERTVYFCPLSSTRLYAINTTILKNEEMAKGNTNYAQYIQDLGVKESQGVGMIMDNMGNLYYGLLGNNAISKWNMNTPFESGQKLIARDSHLIEWPNSFTLEPSGNLTVLINRLNKFIFDKIDLKDVNFRLITSHVGGKSYLYDEQPNYHHIPEGSSTPAHEMMHSSTEHNQLSINNNTIIPRSTERPATAAGNQIFSNLFTLTFIILYAFI